MALRYKEATLHPPGDRVPHALNQSNCCSTDFGAKYALFQHPAFRSLERSVLGCDYGGTSWTTRAQADELPPLLGLGHDTRLLEIGAGSGWPAIYLTARSGCRAALLDLPLNALAQARNRARSDHPGRKTDFICASGTELPFRGSSFAALGHSDVLCCLEEKQAMLAECRRVARTGARMVFFVIAPMDGLSNESLSEALEAGPPFVGMPRPYCALLQDSGWKVADRRDLTPDYLDTLRRMVVELQAGADVFSEIMGDVEFEQELAARRRQIRAVADGLLVRERYLAMAG